MKDDGQLFEVLTDPSTCVDEFEDFLRNCLSTMSTKYGRSGSIS
jgi:hypothetical protein